MHTIDRLIATVEHEMAQVEQQLFEAVASEVEILRAICNHILGSGGKRLRPLLLLLSARVCDYAGQAQIPLACALEYLHTATLLHDDVIDHAEIRRGNSAAHVVWGNQATILAGDFFFSKALSLASSVGDARVIDVFADTSTCLSEAEIFQIARAADLALTEQDYLYIIRNKTASLLAAATRIGGMISGVSPQEEAALQEYGVSLGMAFQIMDDVLDYRSNEQEFGKTIGKDLCEGSLTLPVINALAASSAEDRAALSAMLQDRGQREQHVDRILELVEKYDGTAAAVARAEQYSREAIASVKGFADRSYVWVLEELAQYVVRRRS